MSEAERSDLVIGALFAAETRDVSRLVALEERLQPLAATDPEMRTAYETVVEALCELATEAAE